MNAQPLPFPGEVIVYLLNLARDKDDLNRLRGFLTREETKRATRLIDPQIRNRFIVCRALLRETLAGYLGLTPQDVTLTCNIHGKPCLPPSGPDNHILRFNLSHSGDQAVLALAVHCEIGIDLEQLRQDIPYRTIALQFFSAREQSELFSLPSLLQLSAFYRCWTRKEAYLKGCGTGFSRPAGICDVSLLPGHPPALLGHRCDPDEPARWSLCDIGLGENLFAALAVNAPPPDIRLLRQLPSGVNFY